MATTDYQVIIIGAGITGLSTAYHLNKAGIEQVAILTDPATAPSSKNAAGFLLGSLLDNITRVAHAWGLPVAAEVYNFSRLAFQNLVSFCAEHDVEVKEGGHLRLIVSSSELIESRQAIALLQEAGMKAHSSKAAAHDKAIPCDPAAVFSLQDDGLGGGCLDPAELWQKLSQLSQAIFVSRRAKKIRRNGNCIVHTTRGKLGCELVVLACHHRIPALLPEFAEVVIPYSDQWGSYHAENNPLPAGFVFTANHGHEWGGTISETEICLGGARFLRPLAGTGDDVLCADTSIADYLAQRFRKFMPTVKSLTCDRIVPVIGVRPCDELPIIGPMYGNERLLLATGFMGNGLTWGFMAGKCLAELITTGKSAALPSHLLPKRLRSLPD